MTAKGKTAKTTAAFEPPINATATPERAAARRGEPSREPTTKGRITQGSNTTAKSATDVVTQVKTIGAMQ
jgi:hypothetical protein